MDFAARKEANLAAQAAAQSEGERIAAEIQNRQQQLNALNAEMIGLKAQAALLEELLDEPPR